MLKCIWCSQTEQVTKFDKRAHTIPDSLGGTEFCDNVCSACNVYFGNQHNGMPAIEVIVKELFNITKYRLKSTAVYPENKRKRYTSRYFDVSFLPPRFKLKQGFSIRKGFQEKVTRQLVRGLYKIFLEENERVNGNSHDPGFDFIRSFARYDYDPVLPLFYFPRQVPLIFGSKSHIEEPNFVYWIPSQQNDHPIFFEFELFTHQFFLLRSQILPHMQDDFIKAALSHKPYHTSPIVVKNWYEIDFLLNIFNSKTI